jgi:hypothetical protein
MTWQAARRFGPGLILLGWILGTTGPAHAAPILDQENVVTRANFNGAFFIGQVGIPNTVDVQLAQTFTVGVAGTLARVEVQVNRATVTTVPLVLDIVRTNAGVPDQAAVLASLSIPADAIPLGGTFTDLFTGVDLAGAAFTVNRGDVLALVLTAPGPNPPTLDQYFLMASFSTYSGGGLFRRQVPPGGPFVSFLQDGGFRTYVEPIPEPSSLAMGGIPLLIGLGGAGWRRVPRAPEKMQRTLHPRLLIRLPL